MALDIYFREDLAAAIVAVLIAKGSAESHDLRALAAVVRVPWWAIEEAYQAQMGERVEVRR